MDRIAIGTWEIAVIVVGSITIALISMFILRLFVKDAVRTQLSDFRTNVEGRLSRIEGRLGEINNEISKWTRKISDILPGAKGKE